MAIGHQCHYHYSLNLQIELHQWSQKEDISYQKYSDNGTAFKPDPASISILPLFNLKQLIFSLLGLFLMTEAN